MGAYGKFGDMGDKWCIIAPMALHSVKLVR